MDQGFPGVEIIGISTLYLWVSMAVVSGYLAATKNRNPTLFVVFALIFGVPVWIAAMFSAPKPPKQQRESVEAFSAEPRLKGLDEMTDAEKKPVT